MEGSILFSRGETEVKRVQVIHLKGLGVSIRQSRLNFVTSASAQLSLRYREQFISFLY